MHTWVCLAGPLCGRTVESDADLAYLDWEGDDGITHTYVPDDDRPGVLRHTFWVRG